MFLPCKPLWEPDQNLSDHYSEFIHFKPLMEKQIYHLGPRKWEGRGGSMQSFFAYFSLLNVCFRVLSVRPCNLTADKETYRVVSYMTKRLWLWSFALPLWHRGLSMRLHRHWYRNHAAEGPSGTRYEGRLSTSDGLLLTLGRNSIGSPGKFIPPMEKKNECFEVWVKSSIFKY